MQIQQRNPLARHIDSLVRQRVFPTKGAIAKAIGMTDSGFSRSVQDDGTLTVEQCLRLAAVLRVDLAGILRLAGREALARLVNETWQSKVEQLSRREGELLRRWRAATESEQHAVFSVLEAMHLARSARSGSRPRAAMRKLAKRIRADERAVKAAAKRQKRR